MKIYYHPASTTSRPIMLFAGESGLQADFQVVDLFTGEHFKPPFEAINPNHQVPVLEDGGFRLTESIYSPGLRIPEHSHELAKFCFVISGDYVETLGSRTHSRRPLTLTFHPPDTTHSEAHRAIGHHFLLELDMRWLDYARQYSAILDHPIEICGGMPIRVATQLYNEFRQPVARAVEVDRACLAVVTREDRDLLLFL